MERRQFLKHMAIMGAVAASPVALAGGASAGQVHEKHDEPLRLKDPRHPTDMEKKHVPEIKAPAEAKKNEWFDVNVKVGFMAEHPSTPEHWIDEIKLLVNGREVIELESAAGGTTAPEACFRIRLQEASVLEAIAECNLHGEWISQPVKVAVPQG